MEVSLMMPTHGLLFRNEENAFLPAPDRNVDVVEVAQLAERLDYHSLWFSDHVLMTRSSDSGHPANWSGERAYPGDATCSTVSSRWGRWPPPRRGSASRRVC